MKSQVSVRVEVLIPAMLEQHQRAFGEPLLCVHHEWRDIPVQTSCTGVAALRIGAVPYCAACAGELLERLRDALEMVDMWNDPRREPAA